MRVLLWHIGVTGADGVEIYTGGYADSVRAGVWSSTGHRCAIATALSRKVRVLDVGQRPLV